MYANHICSMAPTGIAMHDLLDASQNYCIAKLQNDILFNHLKSVCNVTNYFVPRY